MSSQHPLLRYAIVTTPSELVEGTTAALTILATNAGSVAREVESLTITLPTNLWAGGAVNAKAPTGWAGGADGAAVTFTPTPAGATHSLNPGETLVFTLADVQLTAKPSLAYVTIHEVVGQAKADSYVWLVARESGAPTLELSGAEVIAPGAQASLRWSGPEHATFTLYSAQTPGGIPLRGTKGDYPVAPTVTTAYTLVAIYTDPATQDTTTLAKQWTITVEVPPPKIKSFMAMTVGVTRLVRFDFEVEHAASLRLVQRTTQKDELLWDSEGESMTSPQRFEISGAGGSEATFVLTAKANAGSTSNDVPKTTTCLIPPPRLLAYAAYVDQGKWFVVTAIEAATTATIGTIVLSDPNGVRVTEIPRAALFADPPVLTGPGQAVATAPDVGFGADGTPSLTGSDVRDDLTRVARFLGYWNKDDATLDWLHNNVIWCLTTGMKGFASQEAHDAAVRRLSGLRLEALIEEALIRGFVWRGGLATPAEIQSSSLADLRKKVDAWCYEKDSPSGVPFDRLDARTLVGAAIALYEQDGLIYGERAMLPRIPEFLPLLRRPTFSWPNVGRFFWIQLKATDPDGNPLVIAPNADGTGLVLAKRALDDRQLWRIDHVSDDADNHREHVKLWNRGLGTYLKSDWGFHTGAAALGVIFYTLEVDTNNATGNLFVPISGGDGQNFNAYGGGPYKAGNKVASYHWCDGQDNEYWQLVEAPGDRGDALGPGNALGVGNWMTSPGASARMVLQMDGNLVIATRQGAVWSAVWSSNTWASPSVPRRVRLVMEADGLNLYDADNTRLWTSGDLPAGCSAVLGDDGILRLMDGAGTVIKSFP